MPQIVIINFHYTVINLTLKFMSEREISKCVHTPQARPDFTHCKKCGVILYEEDNAIKTNLFNSYLNCSANKYLTHMRKRKCLVLDNMK